MPRGRSRSRRVRRGSRERSPQAMPRHRALPAANLPPLPRRRAVRQSVGSSRQSEYPVDARFPVSGAASECASSVTSDVSLGPPLEWVGNASNPALMPAEASVPMSLAAPYPPPVWLDPQQQVPAAHVLPKAPQVLATPPPPPPPLPDMSSGSVAVRSAMKPPPPQCPPGPSQPHVPGVLSKAAAGPPLVLSPAGQMQTSPKAAALIVARHTADFAVAPGDPGAELTLQQAESTLLDEQSMYQLLAQDQVTNSMSHFWQLPPPELIKFSAGRATWLKNQTSSWQRVILTELQRSVHYMLSLLPPDFRNSDQQRLWQLHPSVMLSFCRAMVAVNLPNQSVFQTPARVWACGDRVVWEYSTDKFPGPLTAPTTATTSHYRWYHCGADMTLLGLFTCGRLLRTCAETIGMQAAETPYAFFGKAGFEGQESCGACDAS